MRSREPLSGPGLGHFEPGSIRRARTRPIIQTPGSIGSAKSAGFVKICKESAEIGGNVRRKIGRLPAERRADDGLFQHCATGRRPSLMLAMHRGAGRLNRACQHCGTHCSPRATRQKNIRLIMQELRSGEFDGRRSCGHTTSPLLDFPYVSLLKSRRRENCMPGITVRHRTVWQRHRQNWRAKWFYPFDRIRRARATGNHPAPEVRRSAVNPKKPESPCAAACRLPSFGQQEIAHGVNKSHRLLVHRQVARIFKHLQPRVGQLGRQRLAHPDGYDSIVPAPDDQCA